MPWLIVILFVAIGLYSISPPAPGEADTPDRFSVAAALRHIEAIAQEPHPMGTPAIAQVREYLIAELEKLGLEPELQRSRAPDFFFDAHGIVDVVNIIARIPGQGGDSAVALMAHYDTVPTTPGANDNSAAVAALLETARVLLAGDPVANDVILLFTDGEEPSPRFGVTAFIDDHPDAAEIGFVVNFEALGGSGASMVAETSGGESWIIGEFAAAASHPVAFSFATEIARLLGDIGTDFDPFRNAGVPGLHLVYMRGSPIYHTPADNIEAVGLRSLQHHGDNAVEVARRFGGLDLRTPRGNDPTVFFTLRPIFVRYPAWIGWLLLAAAAGLVARRARRSGLRPRRVLVGGGRSLLGAIGAALSGAVLWVVATVVRETPSVVEAYAYLIVIGGVVIWLGNRIARDQDAATGQVAVATAWILLSLLTVILLPGISYLFTWPLLALGIAGNLQTTSTRRLLGFTVLVGVTAPLLVPAIEFFWQSAQPRPGNPDSSIPAVAVGAFLLVALAGAALRSVWWHPDEP